MFPSPNFPGNLGQETFGNYSLCFVLQNPLVILGRETLLRKITRDVKFLGNFGTAHSKFSRKFWNEFVLLSRVKFVGKFVHAKFSAKFGTGALGLYSEVLRKFGGPKFPGNFGVGNIWQLFAVFFAPKFSGNFGTRNAFSRDYTKCQISRKFWNGPSKFYRDFLGNLINAKFTDSFDLEQELWVCIPKFSENFGEVVFLY